MTTNHPTFPNKFEACYLIAVLIALEMLVSIALDRASLLDNLDWQGASGLITVVGNGLLFIFLMAYKRMNYRDLFHPAANSVVGTLGVAFLPLLLIVPGLVWMTGVLNMFVQSLLPMSAAEQSMFAEMVQIGTISLLFSCIVAPLLEEMLFRGVILRSFLQQYARKGAILWSALLFGLAHLNAYQFFTAFILGIVLGWLYERTRSLWPTILLHAAFNCFVAFSANGGMSNFGASILWFFAAAFVCAIGGGLWLFHMLEPAKRYEKSRGV